MSDDSDDENCCRYGTPLDPYDEDEVPKKKSSYQDVSEQYALDANGKRRFHGAFTGGFSAGHGNTVAVPEGWTPSSFKSSRSDRIQKPQFQKPEDFMDDEDRSEFGIAPKELRTTNDFGGNKRKKTTQFHDGPIPGQPVLQVLLEPVHETAAMKILRSMGWRPGKGVGEKLTRKEKSKVKKVYSCHIPEEFRPSISMDLGEKPASLDSEDSSEEDEEYSEMLFEPDDLEPYVAKPKTNCFGLGYSGLSRHSVLGSFHDSDSGQGEWKGSHLVTSDKGKKVSIRGQAFGVGAMEEEDEDIYSREDLSNYDFALDNLGKSKDKKESGSKSKKLPVSYRSVLEGFVPSLNKVSTIKVYPPPVLPRGFIPSVSKPSRFSPLGEGTSGAVPEVRDRGLGRHDLSAKHRGALLGEITSDSPPNEAVSTQEDTSNSKTKEIQSQTFEERIAAITGRNVSFVSDPSQTDEAKKDEDNATTFKPFASNPSKQLRYEKYVELRSSGQDVTSEDLQTNGEKTRLTEWECARELSEFERSFKLYKPLTGLMNERFVSATRPDEDISKVEKSQRDSCLYADPEKLEAARVGMFGKLTREMKKWIPDSMLCRRFNIADPHEGETGQAEKNKKKLTYSIFEYLEAPMHSKNSFFKEHTGAKSIDKNKSSNGSISISTNKQNENINEPNKNDSILKPVLPEPLKSKRLTVAELFLQEKEKERENLANKKEQLEFNKETEKHKTNEDPEEIKETIDNFNKIDLYKAIFLSDSESDTENNNTQPKDVEDRSKIDKNVFESPPRNVLRNESPPKGIFANLNFERLNSWQNSSTRNNDDIILPNEDTDKLKEKGSDTPKDKAKSPEKEKISESDVVLDCYGPRLPEKHIFRPKEGRVAEKSLPDLPVIDVDSSSDDSDGWVEAGKVKSKKSKSKHKKAKKSGKKKHREHKHKSKRKHKNKKDDD